MAVYVGDESAYGFWLGDTATNRSIASYPMVGSLEGAVAAFSEMPMEELARLGFANPPIHVYVGNKEAVRKSARVTAHVWSGPYPSRSFVRLTRDVYVEAPEPVIIRCAGRLPRGAALGLINRACGAYRISGGCICQRKPLVTRSSLEAYAACARGMRGVKRARWLAPRAAEGAASPREAALAVVLRLPVRDGGFGLPAFELNHPIAPAQVGDPARCGDFVWIVAHLILEYDSDLFHTGAEKIGQDAARRAQLARAGFEVVTLTNWQVQREDELLRVGDLLRERLGLAVLPRDETFLQAHRELRRELEL